jgi:vacuolar-type H+-ATPase subunit B/Vma2
MDIEILLEQEKLKALQVLKEYNTKYTSKNNITLLNTLNYLYSLLEIEPSTEIKKIIEEDIKIIKEYL